MIILVGERQVTRITTIRTQEIQMTMPILDPVDMTQPVLTTLTCTPTTPTPPTITILPQLTLTTQISIQRAKPTIMRAAPTILTLTMEARQIMEGLTVTLTMEVTPISQHIRTILQDRPTTHRLIAIMTRTKDRPTQEVIRTPRPSRTITGENR